MEDFHPHAQLGRRKFASAGSGTQADAPERVLERVPDRQSTAVDVLLVDVVGVCAPQSHQLSTNSFLLPRKHRLQRTGERIEMQKRKQRHLQAQQRVLDRDGELFRVVARGAEEAGCDEDRDGEALPLCASEG